MRSVFLTNNASRIGGAILGIGGFATALQASPTVWKVHNRAGTPIAILCASDELIGISGQARFESPVIASGSSYSHGWGEAWHNDGMGLNAGTFTCKANTSSDGQSVAASITFNVTWDEPAEISILKKDSGLNLSKRTVLPKASVARSRR